MGKCGRRGEHPHARRFARTQIRTRGARRERACTGIGREVTLDILGGYAALDGHAAHTDAILQATAGGADGRSVRRERSKAIRGHQRSSEVVGCKQGLLACTSPIRCNQMQSEVIRGHQRSSRAPRLHEPNQMQSDAISGHQRSSEVIRGSSPARAQCLRERRPLRPETEPARDRCRSPPPSLCAPPARIGGNQRPSEASEAIGGHQKPSEAIGGHQRQSEAIRGHQTPGYVG